MAAKPKQIDDTTEPVFVKVYGAQESIPWNRFRQPRYSLAGRYNKYGGRTGPPGWESIPGLLKRFTNTGSEKHGDISDWDLIQRHGIDLKFSEL